MLVRILLTSLVTSLPMGLATLGLSLVSNTTEADIPPELETPFRIGITENLGPITGAESSNDTARRWGIHGTDLGHMFWHRGKLHMVFGDTFGYPGLGGRNWRSNALARIADPDPAQGLPIESMVVGAAGFARELLYSRKVDGDEKTVIPTHGVSIDGRMFLHYMSVRSWGEHGHWNVGHSGIAYSDDDGETWQQPEGAVWPGGSGFEQVAFVVEGGMLYTFGISEGRWSGVRLRRVEPERILEPSAYRFWDGAAWSADAGAAAALVPAPVGELSVAWSERHRRWLMMYLHPARKAVVVRTAPRLEGPWSDDRVVISARDYPGLYAPYMVPGSDIGDDLYYTLSLWGPYNVFLMKTRLAAAPAPAQGAAR